MIRFRYPASLLRRSEPLRTALTAAAFWTLAVIALTNLRYLHLGGLSQVEVLVVWATMVCCVLLFGLVGVRCVMACRKSGSLVPIRKTLGGTPGLLLFGAVASYLVIGASVLGIEAVREPDTAEFLKYHVLLLGVLAAAAVGGRAVLEGIGVERLLQGVLVVLIVSCAVILASPILRDLGILWPYRLSFRLTGAFLDPNEAGLVACVTVTLAAALLTNGGPRLLGWLGLAAGIAAGLATASRTALAVLGALAVVFLLINVRSKPRTFILAWAATGLVGMAGFAGVVGFSGGVSGWWTLRSIPDVTQDGGLFCDPSPTGNPGADCAVLLAARDILAGDMELNWSRTVPVDRWQGVTVDGSEGRVTGLYLAGLGLNGRIPSDLGRLDRLVVLSLHRNRLAGRIPPELGDLASLEHLSLNYNALTGGIPPELAKLDRLKNLRLAGNRLTGAVPAVLGELDLSVLRLSGNDFDSVPPELTAVAGHDLADTRLCTPLPSTSSSLFDDCAVLLAVKDTLAGDVSLNWHAAVPVGLWQGVTVGSSLGRVTQLDLSGQNLNGRIPPEFGRLDGLITLNLANNRLTGPVPPELGHLVGLRELSLDGNALTGAIPAELGQLSQLKSLWLRRNRLTGPVPEPILDIPAHDLSHLVFCALPSPPSPLLFDDCTLLLAVKETLVGEGVELNWNATLPIDEWQGVSISGSPARVTVLNLGASQLTGHIPPEFGGLDSLLWLDLSYNQLTGPIPPELGQLANLQGILLDGNALTGPIPPALIEISEGILGDLLVCLPPPRISPALFDDCRALLTMKETLAGAAQLNWDSALPLSEWQGVTLGGPEGRVIALELPRRGLNGRIPAALGHLASLRSLVLDGNVLTGAIPPELGKLTDLEILGLAANALTGAIPPELAKLSSLRELWLSGNRLTGSLSPELRSVAGGDAPCPAAPAGNPGLHADCALLLAAKDILAGEARLNWSEHLPIESWRGVTIGGALDRVTRLELASSDLNGRIPPALGRLSQLVALDLSRNRLTGPVPPELGELTNLEHLALSSNALSGPVPVEFEGLEELTFLRLSENDLDIPYSQRLFSIIDNDLALDGLRLRRPLGDAEAAADRTKRDRPDTVRRLFCRPSFGIASELQSDCALLLASRDVLAGDAPLNWSEDTPIEFWQGVTVGGSPKRVTALELPRVGLNGRLFAELGKLGGLVALNLSHNRLAGPIPGGLGGLEHLVSLRLEGNRLTGPVPPELEGLDDLSFLRLAGNDLNQPFPPALHEVVDHDLDTPIFCRPRKIDPGLLADCALLLRVKDALAGDAPLNWREEVPVADWLGVVMDRSRGRVTALDLTQMGLNGRIPAELGQLAELVSLRLGRNRLAGDIPPELGNLVDLRVLALDGNLLAGSVPPELGRLSRLTDLWLHGNRLLGPAPPSVAALPELVVLRLDDDDTAGEPPTQDRGRSEVLDRNLLCQLHLEAPPRLNDDCVTLLDIRDLLAGDVELNWSDAIPISYWRGVTVGLPAIAGEVEEELRVIALDLSHMGLNGRIPAELSALDALAVLRLGDNRLAGSIPPGLGTLSRLRTLNLENNALTGAIPDDLSALWRLVSLRLGNNELTGSTEQFIPLTSLRVLALENNVLRSNIDPQLGNLEQLEELRLENNRLYGSIPETLDWLTRLTVLRLGGNAFFTCVPATAPVAQVRHNDLDSAGLLCGSLPWTKPGLFEDGAYLMRLRDILAGDAVLNWSYARPVASWQGVTIGRSSGRVVALDLRDMNLTGRLPAELSELSHLYMLRLDGNRLTGPIPAELGDLTRLTLLSLDGNRLTGPIPPALGKLLNLTQLWLADNRLTGSIPLVLTEIPDLSLTVAGNRLTGSILSALTRIPYLSPAIVGDNFYGCMPWVLDHLSRHDIDESLLCPILAADRVLLWRLGFEKAMEAPIFGHGFGALVSLDSAPIGNDGGPLNAHNLYLMLLGEAGIVPLLLFVSAIVLLLRAQWGAPKSFARDATMAGVIVIALYSLAFQHLFSISAFMFSAGLSVATGTAHDDGDRHAAEA